MACLRYSTTILGLAAMIFALPGCGDSRDVHDANTYYACSSNDDCVSGFACVCGWCQQIGAEKVTKCDGGGADATDAGSTKDTGGTKDAGGSVDSGPQDTAPIFKDCNLVTWAGCGAGQGCYFDQTEKKKFCRIHGSKKLGAVCSSGNQECGREGTTPLICDAVDNKCYAVCHTDQLVCPANSQCFTLVEGQKGPPLPDKAGICIPN